MSDINKFTTKEVLNKVLLDSSGNAVNAFSHTTQEAFNAALDDDNSRLNVNLVGGTIGGDVTINGDLTVNGDGAGAYDEIINGNLIVTTDDNSDTLTLISTDADANAGAYLNIYRNSGSPADNDQIGQVTFSGRNDNSEDVDYARIITQIKDASDGSELSRLAINTMVTGGMYSRINIMPTETVFNDESTDLDFRVESNNNANMLFVDAGNDRVGIGTASPAVKLQIDTPDSTEAFRASSDGDAWFKMEKGQAGHGGAISLEREGGSVNTSFNASPSFSSYINAQGGNLGIGTTSPAAPLVIQTTNTLGLDSAPTGSVSIGSPSSTPQGAVLGRQTANAVALNIMAAGVDGNTNGDMIFNTRENNNSGFATLTNSAFKFQHYTTDLVNILRNGNTTFAGDVMINSSSANYADLTVGGTGDIVALRASSGTAGFTMYEAGTGRFNMTTLNGSNGIAFKIPSTTAMVLDANSRISLSNNDNNTSNTVFGKSAFNAGSDNSSDFNTVFGELVMGTGTVNGADNNSGFGYKAIQEITSASNNTAVGFRAGTSITTGDGNVIMGSTAGDAITTESNCTLIGQFAGSGINSTDANGSTAVGNTALWKNTSGQRNNALGFQSLAQNTTGDDNIAIGYQSLTASAESQAHRNIAIGSYALSTLNARGQNNIAIGFEALETANHADVDVNIAIGNYVLDDVGGAGVWACVGIGHNALTSVNHAGAVGSTAIGYYSLSSLTSGAGNTAVGFEALKTISSGTTSTAVGYEALELATGNSNTAIGYEAGNIISTGTECTILGGFSNPSANNASNETVVGSGITGNGSNSVTLGNTSVTAVYMAKDSGAVVHASGLKFDNDQTNNIDEANTLDDYEEGTYTPSITGSSSGNYVLNTSYDSTSYTKIGRQVTMTGEIRVASDNSASGTIRVSIPFAVAQLTDTAGVSISNIFVSGHGDADIDSNKLLIYLDEGTQYFTIFEVNDDDSTVVLTDSHFDTAFNLTFTFTYFTS